MRAVVEATARFLEPLADIGRPETVDDREGRRGAVVEVRLQDLLSYIAVSACQYQCDLSWALRVAKSNSSIRPVSFQRVRQ